MASHKKRKILKLLLIRQISKERRRKYWVHPVNQCRHINGEHLKLNEMYKKYPDRFASYTRMCPATFDKLELLVGSTLAKKNTNYRKSIPARIRLYVILRFLATGDSMRSIATNFSMGYATVWRIIHDGLPIIWNLLKDKYVKFPNTEDWKHIADEFWNKWNMPNCLGAIDGKHVVIEAPARSGSLYFNYKGTFSIVLLATCDADYNFTYIDVGGYGKQSDGGIFSGSTLGRRLQNGTLNICGPRNLPGTTILMPCFFVGDEAFPLSTKLMRPYPGKSLTEERRIFNYRLSRARRCIENAFGILTSRWRIFRRPIDAEPKQVENIVLASVALHNFLKKEGTVEEQRHFNELEQGDDSGNRPIDLDNVSGLMNGRPLSIAAQERASKLQRDALMAYLVNEGAVDWQRQKIGV